MNKNKTVDFSQGSVWRHVANQTLPLMIAQLVQLLYNIVDRVYLGHLKGIGDMALTGVGLIFPVTTLILAFTFMMGMGGAPIFSIARGAGNEEEAGQALGHAVTLLLACGLVLMFMCYMFKKPLLYGVGASDVSYTYANTYLNIYLVGTIPVMLSTGLNGFINAQGFPRTGMGTILLGAAMNLVLDPVFIFLFDMKVAGAALATVISQTAACIWVLAFFFGRKNAYPIQLKYMKLTKDMTLRILALGMPGFFMQGTNMATQVVCNRMLSLYGGDLYIGIMTILNSIRETLALPAHSMGEGCKPVMGYNLGAKCADRVKSCIRLCTMIGFGYLTVIWGLSMIFGRYIFQLFTNNQEMLDKGLDSMHVFLFGFCFMAFQFVGQSTFTGLGLAKKAVFFSLFRKIIIVVPLTILLPLKFGIMGVFLAEPISNLVGGLACYTTMYLTVYRRMDQLVAARG